MRAVGEVAATVVDPAAEKVAVIHSQSEDRPMQ